MKRSVKEIKRLARANMMGNYRLMAWVYLLATTIPLLLQAPFSLMGIGNVGNMIDDMLYMFSTILITIVESGLLLGQQNCHLWLARHREVDSKDVFYCFRNHTDHFLRAIVIRSVIATISAIPLQAALIIYNAYGKALTPKHMAAIAGLGILSGLLNLLVILLLDLAYYLTLDFYDMPMSFAMKESIRLMKGNKLRLIKLYLSFAGMMLLGVLSMGFGLIFVFPYLSQSLAVFYLDVIDEVEEWQPPVPDEFEPSDEPNEYTDESTSGEEYPD